MPALRTICAQPCLLVLLLGLPLLVPAEGPVWDPLASEAFASVSQKKSPLVRVVLESRLAEDLDADRVALPAQALVEGKPLVVQGRLAKLTLVARPWSESEWQVRYELEPRTSGGRRIPAGVFLLREKENKELWLGAPSSSFASSEVTSDSPRAFGRASFHGVRLEFESGAKPPARRGAPAPQDALSKEAMPPPNPRFNPL